MPIIIISDMDLMAAIDYLGIVIYPTDHKNRKKFMVTAFQLTVRELRNFSDSSKTESNDLGKKLFGKNWNKFKIDKAESTLNKAGRILDKRIIAFHSLEYAAQEKIQLNEAIITITNSYQNRDGKKILEDNRNIIKRIFSPSKRVIHLVYGLYVSFIKRSTEHNFITMLLEPTWVDVAIKESKNYLKNNMNDVSFNKKLRKNTKVEFKSTEIIFVKKQPPLF